MSTVREVIVKALAAGLGIDLQRIATHPVLESVAGAQKVGVGYIGNDVVSATTGPGIQDVAVPAGVAVTSVPETDVDIMSVQGVPLVAPYVPTDVAALGGIAVTAAEGLPVLPRTTYDPVNGTALTLNITLAVATITGAALPAGLYEIHNELAVRWRRGANIGDVAVATDPYLPAGSTRRVEFDGLEFLSVIGTAGTLANGFHYVRIG